MGDGGRRLRLGINWYRVADEAHNLDGKHTEYLSLAHRYGASLRACDSQVYDGLAALLATGRRRVADISTLGFFPGNTTYFGEPLTFDGLPVSERTAARRAWIERALRMTAGSDIVFADPDNGLEGASVGPSNRRGPKFAFFADLLPFVDRGQSLVIYHHLDRSAPAVQQAQRRLQQIKGHLGVAGAFALQYQRNSARLFIVVPNERDQALLVERATMFATGPWGAHFLLRTA